MFKKHDEEETPPKKRKKGLGFVGFFRLIISLCMLAVLGFVFYRAYTHFSGVDPLTIDSKASIHNVLFSDKMYDLVTGLLTVDPKVSIERFKSMLRGEAADTPSQHAASAVHSKQEVPLLFRFAIVADSHNENSNLGKALAIAKAKSADFVIGLGDYTDVGTKEELQNSKKEFDASGLPYYVTAGDHDLWDSRNRNLPATANFSEVFGTPYLSFSHKNVRFIVMYNSDNYLGVDGIQLNWLQNELQAAKEGGYNTIFVFTGIPLFHPSSDHVMGKSDPKLRLQAQQLIDLIKQAGVAELFAADAHFYSRFIEPRSDLKMTVAGALTSARNLQAPRFVLVDVYTDGSYNIQDTEL